MHIAGPDKLTRSAIPIASIIQVASTVRSSWSASRTVRGIAVGLYYTMSTWNPYQVMVMQSDLRLGLAGERPETPADALGE
jgi:hypothetical protein